MSIAVEEQHQQLAEVARSFLRDRGAALASRDALDAGGLKSLPEIWGEIAGLGWLGLHLPEEHGGSGFGLVELAVVLEESGAALAPGPLAPTVVTSALIDQLGSDRQRRDLLPSFADGSAAAGLGLHGSLRASADGTVSGNAGVVVAAGVATLFAVACGDDVAIVPADAAGASISLPESLDPGQPSGRVYLHAVTPIAVLSGARRHAVALASALGAAQASGGARACLEMAVDYAKVRQQFGRPIGSFQAVKHHCANMLVHAELAAAAVWDAARVLGRGQRDHRAELAGAVAATLATQAYLHNAQLNIQVHGGIGFTWEHDAHLHLRRAAALAGVFGGHAAATAVARLRSTGVERLASIDLPPEAEAVRAEVRAFVATLAGLPPGQQRARIVEHGYAQPHWPAPWGRDAGAIEQIVIDEEFAGIDRPEYGIGGWIVPTLVQHGTDEQVQRWIPPTMAGELVWCQMFSEPDAGSDAAGVTTRATKVEGGWRVNGQKVWTSRAETCDRGLATVRTNPSAPKHAGISMMVIDLHAPGVDVRPLRDITGSMHFNEVFLDDVFVPDNDVVGEVDGGWLVARSTLANERVSVGTQSAFGGPVDLADIYRQLGEARPDAAPAVGVLLAQSHALAALTERAAQRAISGREPGTEGNITKLVRAENTQQSTNLAAALLGPDVALRDGLGAPIDQSLLHSRMATIAGGTSEITRNQIAERILGLPRESLRAQPSSDQRG